MKVLFDARPGRACLTGIGRYARTVSGILKGLPGHDCASLGVDVELESREATGEEVALSALLFSEQIDVFHSPLFQLPPLLPCGSVITLHDAIPLVRPDLCSAEFARFFSRARRAVERADAVVCPSESARRDIQQALGVTSAKTHVVPEAPAACFQTLAEEDARRVLAPYELAERFLLVVGSIERRKNPRVVLDALELLEPSDRPVVVFAGPPAGWNLAFDVRLRELEPWVRILGPVDDRTLVALYNLAEALVFPSLYEGFGLPVVEAFATRTPVIASHAASLPEVVGEAGLLFDPENSGELVELILRLLRSPQLADQLRARGSERLQRFSPAAVARGFSQLYGCLKEVVA